ncbi:MAG: molybdenum cofactor biosynthesis protein MoaE [Planctomycetota bacterium]|nr:MAG: molybdenum cofactor biosynthesis protein MoaE [Planctomycetota bacterium]REJ98544.1 MAG: molybdenum cofactor biosynthesis protein MoaE [Planctomycetota bacterium]REK29844.1 MAG: molybdenum cofactor biosynthesis protein MoaE [Planctomycetota bacterium]REK47985.1 MAG: molybdenum cofactor biosynthesis protein MoaE [Planctomycetota bacterium]
MIELTDQTLDTQAILAHVAADDAGAMVLFLGTTRRHTDGRETASLDYQCYEAMARSELAELEAEARRRWPLTGCAIVHRLGHLEIGEASVAVAVSSPHREAAFESGKWLIDTIKQVVPIWKCENWADGERQWVHPAEAAEAGSPSRSAQARMATGSKGEAPTSSAAARQGATS